MVIVVLFIVSSGNFLFTTVNIARSSYMPWGMIGRMTPEEQRAFHEKKEQERINSEKAKQTLEATKETRSLIAYVCAGIATITLICSFFSKRKMINIPFSIIVLLSSVILIL